MRETQLINQGKRDVDGGAEKAQFATSIMDIHVVTEVSA
jgi:hypothetical protein